MVPTLVAVLLLSACSESSGGPAGDAPLICDTGERTPLALDEVSPGGFSADGFLSAHGSTTATLSWVDGGTVPLSVDFAADDELAAEIAWVVPYDDCDPFLELPVWLGIHTDDGAFDDELRTVISIVNLDAAVAWADTYGDMLGGDVDLARFGEIASLQDTIVYFQAVVSPAGAWGTVQMRAQDEVHGSDLVDVASWME